MTQRRSNTTDRDEHHTRAHAPLFGAQELIAECQPPSLAKHFYVAPRPGYEGGYCQKPGCGRTPADLVHLEPALADFGCA